MILETNTLYSEVEYLAIIGEPEINTAGNRTVWQCPLCREWQLDCQSSLQPFAARDIEQELELHVVACKGKYASSKVARSVKRYRNEILFERLKYIMFADYRSGRKKGVRRGSQHKR